MKERGILLPIFSLPSKYGIGDFGNEAYEFIDILSENGIEYWQILPINANDNLPYSPLSYYAIEEDYISLDKLKEAKLIKNIEQREISDRVIYDNFKQKYYKQAFKNFKKTKNIENKKILNIDKIDNIFKNLLQYAPTMEEKVTINEIEIPAFYNKKNDLTLVGLKDEKGSIYLYIYDEQKNSYQKYF